MKKKVRVGTRNIPLTIAQTNIVVGIAPGYQFELILMGTLGDRDKQTPLSELGPQGVFADELSSAILAKELDFAVHSLKDLPIKRTEGLTVVYPKRENPFDSLIIREGKTLEQLPVAALIGTSSFRREVELLQLRPDLRPAPIRGNIDQRLEQLNQGGFAGIILANAGLNRLGWQNPRHFSVINFDQHTFIPSAGQGTLALECRQSDHTTQTLLRNIADGDTMTCMAAERSFLEAMGEMASHQTCAAYATISDEKEVVLTVMLADKQEMPIYLRQTVTGHAQCLGEIAANSLKKKWLKLKSSD